MILSAGSRADERLGFSELIEQHLTSSRTKNVQLPLADLLRQSICNRMAGYKNALSVIEGKMEILDKNSIAPFIPAMPKAKKAADKNSLKQNDKN